MKIFAGNIETTEGFFDFVIQNGAIIVMDRNNNEISNINIGSLNINVDGQLDYFIKMYKKTLGISGNIIKIGMIPEKFRFVNQKATDMFVFHKDGSEIGIVLGKRKYPPFGYALFGGMVEVNETFETNSKKELEEESGLTQSDIISMTSLGHFDCTEIRGNLTTNLNVVEISNSKKNEIEIEYKTGKKSYDDIVELIFVNQEELQQLIENNQVVPHHVELIKVALHSIEG